MRHYRHAIRLAAALVAASTATSAMARPDTRQMTCAEVRQLIASSGSIVLTTGRFTYDRFVADNQYCDHPNVATLMPVATRDNPQCPVYNCQRTDPFEP